MEINIESLSFEEAFKKLEEITKLLEKGDCPLDKAMQYYDLGIALKNKCYAQLNAARGKLEQVVNENGQTQALNLE